MPPNLVVDCVLLGSLIVLFFWGYGLRVPAWSLQVPLAVRDALHKRVVAPGGLLWAAPTSSLCEATTGDAGAADAAAGAAGTTGARWPAAELCRSRGNAENMANLEVFCIFATF